MDFKETFEDDDFFANAKEVPAHACCYCGLHKPEYVVKCNICNKWFCNSRSGTKGSHIVTHLVRSKHKEATLHPDRCCPLPQVPTESASNIAESASIHA
jgi:regulator of nonsense transcripts 1